MGSAATGAPEALSCGLRLREGSESREERRLPQPHREPLAGIERMRKEELSTWVPRGLCRVSQCGQTVLSETDLSGAGVSKVHADTRKEPD